MAPAKKIQFDSFADFWPYYVGAHRNKACRSLHYVGAGAVISCVIIAVWTQTWWVLALAPIAGYGFAWVGHFCYEANHPATFEYPVYSLMAEFKMFWLGITGRMQSEVHQHAARDPDQK